MRTILFATAFALATVAVPYNSAMAKPVKVRLCTGEVGLPSHGAGQMIEYMAKSSPIVNVSLVSNTGGTKNNIDRAMDLPSDDPAACDAWIGQPNGLSERSQNNPVSLMPIQQIGNAQKEYAQLICSVDSKVTSIKDLVKNPKNYSIALGGQGSGAWLTWDTWVQAEPALKGVATTAEDGSIAVVAVSNNNTSCALMPEGLRGRWMNFANIRYGDKIRLVSADLSSFGKIKDFKNRDMYKFEKIPSNFYDRLQPKKFFGSEVGVVSWDAGIYINSDRVKDSRVIPELVSIIGRASTQIQNKLNVTK